jgi:hypothetical protein
VSRRGRPDRAPILPQDRASHPSQMMMMTSGVSIIRQSTARESVVLAFAVASAGPPRMPPSSAMLAAATRVFFLKAISITAFLCVWSDVVV